MEQYPVIADLHTHVFGVRESREKSAPRLLSGIDFPEELILNVSADRLNDYLEKRTHIFTNRPNQT